MPDRRAEDGYDRLRDVDASIRKLSYINANSTLIRRFHADGSYDMRSGSNAGRIKAFPFQLVARQLADFILLTDSRQGRFIT